MLTLIFFLMLVPTLTVAITVGVWYWFNRENEKAMEIKELLIEIRNDTDKTIKHLKGLSDLLSEVAQPLLNSSAIDVESLDVKDEKIIKIENEEETKVEFIDGFEIPENTNQNLEIKSCKMVEDVIDEVEIFTELIQKEDNLIRLQAAMEEWKAKGNEQLTNACADAIEELKAKQNSEPELINLWSEEELQMEEDIAS